MITRIELIPLIINYLHLLPARGVFLDLSILYKPQIYSEIKIQFKKNSRYLHLDGGGRKGRLWKVRKVLLTVIWYSSTGKVGINSWITSLIPTHYHILSYIIIYYHTSSYITVKDADAKKQISDTPRPFQPTLYIYIYIYMWQRCWNHKYNWQRK